MNDAREAKTAGPRVPRNYVRDGRGQWLRWCPCCRLFATMRPNGDCRLCGSRTPPGHDRRPEPGTSLSWLSLQAWAATRREEENRG